MANSSSNYLLLALCIVATKFRAAYAAERTLPAIFIFGDSAIDIGTNNYVNGSLATANHPYHGIDYPHSIPTGRFSNGYNVGDQIAMLFGFKKSPPTYLYLVNHPSVNFTKKVQRGVNFASAGAGLQDRAGMAKWKQLISMKEQIEQFSTIPGNLTLARGPEGTAKIISKALYIFCVGANDMLDYMRANGTTPRDELLASLQSLYYGYLKAVYNLGARKFGIIGVPLLGCCPYARALNVKQGGGNGCMQILNDISEAFQNATATLLQKMISDLPEMKYSLGNTVRMTVDLLDNYASYGFNESKWACCGNGNYNGEYFPCDIRLSPNLCRNRSEYFFWDMYHPTQAASQLVADRLYRGDTNYMSPMNFSRLAQTEVHN